MEYMKCYKCGNSTSEKERERWPTLGLPDLPPFFFPGQTGAREGRDKWTSQNWWCKNCWKESMRGLIQRSGEHYKKSDKEIKEEMRRHKVHKPGCFLTSACVLAQGLSDDCYELVILRKFRDEFIITCIPEGKDMVSQYYAVAPKIVCCIDTDPHKIQIYNKLYHSLVVPSVKKILEGDAFCAMQIYIAHVKRLMCRYLSSC